MAAQVKTFPPKKLIGVARAFTHFLALSNSAEFHHRVRRLRDTLLSSDTDSALPLKENGSWGTLQTLKESMKVPVDEIFKAISKQSVEIVLTAHPTEVNRRSIIQKHQRIHEILGQFDRTDLTLYERRALHNELKAQVCCIWETDELRRVKPGPVKEALNGIAVVENILWNAIPNYLRKLDDTLKQSLGYGLPLTSVPLKVASWMGGDRDGKLH